MSQPEPKTLAPRKLRAFYDPAFEAPIGNHIMPIQKFRKVADQVAGLEGVRLVSPNPAGRADLERVHSHDYVEAIRTGAPRELAESQKFPWSPALYPSVCRTSGGVIDASHAALDDGAAAAIASGFHHAHDDHGEGFCTFNGLVVAAEHLRHAGRARNIAILDLDLHYGNGTAQLAGSRPWLRALSLYGNDYVNNTPYRDVTQRRHQDGANHRSIPLPAGCGREQMLGLTESSLPWLWEGEPPDLLLYQAGADPFREDPYSPLDLGIEDLRARDALVFRTALRMGTPVAWVLAGGYAPDLSKVVEIHVNTFRAWFDENARPRS
ncbi:MAG TPA: histone deacetylase [Verrucomicrobiales bacterium]|nr:histone deacetylase [Verrucomicrobiales bacterium]